MQLCVPLLLFDIIRLCSHVEDVDMRAFAQIKKPYSQMGKWAPCNRRSCNAVLPPPKEVEKCARHGVLFWRFQVKPVNSFWCFVIGNPLKGLVRIQMYILRNPCEDLLVTEDDFTLPTWGPRQDLGLTPIYFQTAHCDIMALNQHRKELKFSLARLFRKCYDMKIEKWEKAFKEQKSFCRRWWWCQ